MPSKQIYPIMCRVSNNSRVTQDAEQVIKDLPEEEFIKIWKWLLLVQENTDMLERKTRPTYRSYI